MTPEERDTMIGAEMEAQLPPEFRLDYKGPPPKPPEKQTVRAHKEKGPEKIPGLCPFRLIRAGLIIHTTHAAHAATRHGRGPTVLFGPFGDHGFCGDE